MGTLHINGNKGDVAETILMPGDPLRAKFIAENYLTDVNCYTEIRGMLGFTGTYKGKRISVQGSGMGMPSMGIYSHELISHFDVKNLIRIGTAGSFQEDVKIKDIVLGLSASTDSNWAHTYELPGTFAPCADFELLIKAKNAADALGVPVHAGNIVSCDVFYECDPDWWKKWAALGTMAVEMEAAALYMNAAKLGANALAMVTISDNFITGEKASVEDRQQNFRQMMEIALELA